MPGPLTRWLAVVGYRCLPLKSQICNHPLILRAVILSATKNLALLAPHGFQPGLVMQINRFMGFCNGF